MFGFLAICAFAAAHWLDKKLRMPVWGGIVPLTVALCGSMLLYASALSTTALGWANWLIVPLTSWFGGLIGESLSPATVYGVACIAGAAVTVMDLWKDHTYNPRAIAAMIITPIAAHGAAAGWLPQIIDALHSAGAAIVAGWVGATVGG